MPADVLGILCGHQWTRPATWTELSSRVAAVLQTMVASSVQEHFVTRLQEHPARIDDLPSQISQGGIEMRAEFSALRADMATAREMRALHQEVIRRLALLQEAVTRAKRKSRKKQQ